MNKQLFILGLRKSGGIVENREKVFEREKNVKLTVFFFFFFIETSKYQNGEKVHYLVTNGASS